MKKTTAVLIMSFILIFLSINISLAFKWEVNYPFGNPSPDLPSYINSVYKIAFFLGSFLAVLMIVIAGIQWATPTSNPNVKFAAKKRFTSAIMGLILLFGMYLILKAINPDILILKDLNIEKATPGGASSAGGGGIFEEDQVVFKDSNWCYLNNIGIYCGNKDTTIKCCTEIDCSSGDKEGSEYNIEDDIKTANCPWGTSFYWAGSGKTVACEGDKSVQLYCNEGHKCEARYNPEWPNGCSAVGKTCTGGVCH